jgi:hypothetical protein
VVAADIDEEFLLKPARSAELHPDRSRLISPMGHHHSNDDSYLYGTY